MLRYELTAQDIAVGCRGDGDNCPHTIAIEEHVKPEYHVWIDQGELLLMHREDGSEYVFDTTDDVGAWIGVYDEYGTGAPGWFEIDIPQEFLRTQENQS